MYNISPILLPQRCIFLYKILIVNKSGEKVFAFRVTLLILTFFWIIIQSYELPIPANLDNGALSRIQNKA